MSRRLWLILSIAFRNLFRAKRRTLFTLASIACGLAMILWLQCILEGRNRNMIDSITTTQTGHLQVYSSEYLKDRLLQSTLIERPQALEKLPPDSVISPRIYLPALISSGETSLPISLQGIEPETEARITRIKDILSEGGYLEAETDPLCPSRQIYLGAGLAEALRVRPGQKVVLMAQAADGTLGNNLFRVKGIYTTGTRATDKYFAYAPISCVAQLGALQGVHEWVIRIPKSEKMDAYREILNQALPETMVATTWKEALPQVAGMVKFNHATLMMISTMLFTIVSIGTVNTLLMSILERTREFGVMIALGTTPFQLKWIVFAESLILGVLSALLGTALGMAVVLYHQYWGFDLTPFLGKETGTDQFKFDWLIYPVFEFSSYFKSVGLAVTFVLMASLYPAYRASRLSPVEAMRSV